MSEIDIPYNFSSSVTDTDTKKDVDQNNKSILVQFLKETDGLIARHNTFDVIVPSKDFTVEEQMVAHKLLVGYLRNFREDLAKKIEELTNGR